MNKIECARKILSYNLKNFSKNICTPQWISQIENNDFLYTDKILKEIENKYGLSSKFVYKESVVFEYCEKINFTNYNKPAMLIQKINAYVSFLADSVIDYLPENNLPNFLYDDKDYYPEYMAIKFRNILGIKTLGIDSVTDIIESYGIGIFEIPIKGNFISVSARVKDKIFIIINKEYIAEDRRYFLAMELYNIITKDISSKREEYGAKRFADEFLYPVETFLCKPNCEFSDILRLKEVYKLSVFRIIDRVFDLDIINSYRRGKLKKEKKMMYSERFEPNSIKEEIPKNTKGIIEIHKEDIIEDIGNDLYSIIFEGGV